jgi:hypothetical protein
MPSLWRSLSWKRERVLWMPTHTMQKVSSRTVRISQNCMAVGSELTDTALGLSWTSTLMGTQEMPIRLLILFRGSGRNSGCAFVTFVTNAPPSTFLGTGHVRPVASRRARTLSGTRMFPRDFILACSANPNFSYRPKRDRPQPDPNIVERVQERLAQLPLGST